jgi:hypothetical protein
MRPETAKKIKTVAAVFELPQKLGILQYVEYEPPPREWCTNDGCLYEGLLTAEGCRRGICVKYRVWVYSKDKRRWEAKERWRRRGEEVGGCIRRQVADALWELADRFDVGVWYERVRVGAGVNLYDVFCGVVVNGVKLYQPHCRSVEDCVKQIIEDYKAGGGEDEGAASAGFSHQDYDPAEELLREWPELGAFGTEWVRKWLPILGEAGGNSQGYAQIPVDGGGDEAEAGELSSTPTWWRCTWRWTGLRRASRLTSSKAFCAKTEP